MRMCANCGAVIADESKVEAPRMMFCDNCGWSGSSVETVWFEGEIPPSMKDFCREFIKVVSPQIGSLLIRHKIITMPDRADDVPKAINLLARILKSTTTGTLTALASAIVKEQTWEKLDKDQEIPS